MRASTLEPTGVRATVLCTACWSGDPAEGERALRPLRTFGPPLADAIGVVSYARLTDRPGFAFGVRVFGPARTPTPTGVVYDYWKGGSLQGLSDQVIDRAVSLVMSASRGMSMGLGYYMHGQICRVGTDATPLPRVAGQFTYFFDANWRDPARAEAAMTWVDESWSAMRPLSSVATYINYLSSDTKEAVRAAAGDKYK